MGEQGGSWEEEEDGGRERGGGRGTGKRSGREKRRIKEREGKKGIGLS